MRWFYRWYGANPLHLLTLIASFALAGYAAEKLLPSHTEAVAIWFIGAVVGHDLLLMPLYTIADVSVLAIFGHRRQLRPPTVSWINYLRVPAVLSGLLLLIWFPLIFRLPSRYTVLTGLPIDPYMSHWLAVTGVLFLLSAVALAVRLSTRAVLGAGRGAGRHGPDSEPLPSSQLWEPTQASTGSFMQPDPQWDREPQWDRDPQWDREPQWDPEPQWGPDPRRPEPQWGPDPRRPEPQWGPDPRRPEPQWGSDPRRPEPQWGSAPRRPEPQWDPDPRRPAPPRPPSPGRQDPPWEPGRGQPAPPAWEPGYREQEEPPWDPSREQEEPPWPPEGGGRGGPTGSWPSR
jgi:hypothetical protein